MQAEVSQLREEREKEQGELTRLRTTEKEYQHAQETITQQSTRNKQHITEKRAMTGRISELEQSVEELQSLSFSTRSFGASAAAEGQGDQSIAGEELGTLTEITMQALRSMLCIAAHCSHITQLLKFI